MATKKLLKNLNIGVITGLAIAVLSFIIPIVPCTKAPVIAEPVYAWGMCRLPNPFGEQLLGISTKYYGIFTESLAGAVLQFIIPLAIITVILMYSKKNSKKIMDLTKN